jgi:alkanesulfonate monooxygenase SsuD/methylene tetrahydromethanopterin reductase-like flavin-dependent oxidoreductase (luciferase family)
VRFGLIAGLNADFADLRTVASLAREAEQAGWDGFFVWDHIATATSPGGRSTQPEPLADPWITMAAIAMSTERIRFGPMVTPLPRRRPWKVAREAVSLDYLSNGRLILPVGSGYAGIIEEEFAQFGEETDARVRAAMFDEGLQVLAGLWSGEPFVFDGTYYHLRETVFLPTPVQRPRIPIWVAATWPHKATFRRAARWDGVRVVKYGGALTPDDVREMVAYIAEHRDGNASFDVVVGGALPQDDPTKASEIVGTFADAGATWWIGSVGMRSGGIERSRRLIEQGPPREK